MNEAISVCSFLEVEGISMRVCSYCIETRATQMQDSNARFDLTWNKWISSNTQTKFFIAFKWSTIKVPCSRNETHIYIYSIETDTSSYNIMQAYLRDFAILYTLIAIPLFPITGWTFSTAWGIDRTLHIKQKLVYTYLCQYTLVCDCLEQCQLRWQWICKKYTKILIRRQ